MKIHVLFALAGLIIGFAAPAFAQEGDTVDPQIAQQIRALTKQCEQAYNKHDAAAVASFFSEDAEWKTPEGSFEGRQAIQDRLQTYHFGRWHLKNEVITVDRVDTVGFLVAATGSWSNTVQESGGNVTACNGHFTSFFARDGDTWKVRYSSYDLASP